MQPQWQSDGRQLYYIAADKKLVSVEVKLGQSDFAKGEARELFDTRNTERFNLGLPYAVTADGQRILVSTATDTIRSITLALNWTAALKR